MREPAFSGRAPRFSLKETKSEPTPSSRRFFHGPSTREALFFRGGHRSGGDLRRDRTHRIDSILHESFLLRFLFGNGSTSVGPCARSLGGRDSGELGRA